MPSRTLPAAQLKFKGEGDGVLAAVGERELEAAHGLAVDLHRRAAVRAALDRDRGQRHLGLAQRLVHGLLRGEAHGEVGPRVLLALAVGDLLLGEHARQELGVAPGERLDPPDLDEVDPELHPTRP